ncbi:hypothetical protein [Limnobacter sp.]|uniref:hypothetical protein n=1 Tax=Limnobacter sp. TaxID=2003368 RepID=UPI003515974E
MGHKMAWAVGAVVWLWSASALAAKPNTTDGSPILPISAAQAGSKMGQAVLVDFKVRSTQTRTDGYGAYVLHSETSARAPNNLSIVIDARAADIYSRLGIFDPASYFFGKRIRVAGVVSTWDGQVQILVGDPVQIEVLR